MKLFVRTLFVALAAVLVSPFNVSACAPLSLNGRTITFTIQSGSGIFARRGSFLFVTTTTGYKITPLSGPTIISSGKFAYSQVDDASATMDFSDVGTRGFPYSGTFDSLAFTSPNAGTFHRVATGGADGEQTGTFQVAQTKEDFNRDGQTDFLWEDDQGHINLWYMTRNSLSRGVSLDGLYDDGSGRPRDAAWRIVAQDDLGSSDGSQTINSIPDGNTDILFQNRDDGSVKVWYLNRTNFVDEVQLNLNIPDNTWRVVGIADFDNDCQLDLLLQSADGHVQLITGFLNGNTFDGGMALNDGNPAMKGWKAVGVADFNNDGKPDILWQNKANASLAVWYMDGTTLVKSLVLGNFPTSPLWWVTGIADINHDGQMDLIVRHIHGFAGVWYMKGSRFSGSVAVKGGLVAPKWELVGPR